MTPKQKELVRHALGFDAQRKSYRNRYHATHNSPDHKAWVAMVAQGWAEVYDTQAPFGMTCFVVTRKAAIAVMEPGESLDHEDFPEAA